MMIKKVKFSAIQNLPWMFRIDICSGNRTALHVHSRDLDHCKSNCQIKFWNVSSYPSAAFTLKNEMLDMIHARREIKPSSYSKEVHAVNEHNPHLTRHVNNWFVFLLSPPHFDFIRLSIPLFPHPLLKSFLFRNGNLFIQACLCVEAPL